MAPCAPPPPLSPMKKWGNIAVIIHHHKHNRGKRRRERELKTRKGVINQKRWRMARARRERKAGTSATPSRWGSATLETGALHYAKGYRHREEVSTPHLIGPLRPGPLPSLIARWLAWVRAGEWGRDLWWWRSGDLLLSSLYRKIYTAFKATQILHCVKWTLSSVFFGPNDGLEKVLHVTGLD